MNAVKVETVGASASEILLFAWYCVTREDVFCCLSHYSAPLHGSGLAPSISSRQEELVLCLFVSLFVKLHRRSFFTLFCKESRSLSLVYAVFRRSLSFKSSPIQQQNVSKITVILLPSRILNMHISLSSILLLPMLALAAPTALLPRQDSNLTISINAATSAVTSKSGRSWYTPSFKVGNSGRSDPSLYTCYSGPASNFPSMDQWMSFQSMWKLMARDALTPIGDTEKEQSQMLSAIKTVSKQAKVDARVILAVIIGEVRCHPHAHLPLPSHLGKCNINTLLPVHRQRPRQLHKQRRAKLRPHAKPRSKRHLLRSRASSKVHNPADPRRHPGHAQRPRSGAALQQQRSDQWQCVERAQSVQ
jgi:hypothetical protein